MNKRNCDFSGWATRNDLLCGDGRTIRKDAFKDNDNTIVPLVWNHQHDNPDNVLGHALLENRDNGVYAYCKFNDTESGQASKELVKHGDVTSLSIYANKLKQIGGDVVHGTIRELSLVLAGANPGAYIDTVMVHSDDGTDELEMTASYNENITILQHADDYEEREERPMTIDEVIDSMDENQLALLEAALGEGVDDEEEYDDYDEEYDEEYDDYDEGDYEMKHNLFDFEDADENVISHAATETIINDGKRLGSMKESFLAHADEYGIANLEYLFPEAHNLDTTPQFIKRDTGWVGKLMAGVKHSPFSRIKSMFADITEDEARAKGYIKGKLKKEEVFSLLKRTTTPTTVYKKQKMDRDDIIDITDFDVIAWIKSEMRLMLDEEIARAILIGDGRLASSDDKIKEDCIRPVWKMEDLFTVKTLITYPSTSTDEEKAKAFIKAVIKSRKNYKGSGNPTLWTTEDRVTDCLLIEDSTGRRIYNSVTELATALRVKEIVTVEVMENQTRTEDSKTLALEGLIFNPVDYTVGADKGGSINMFEDFDIDYNQQKYLIETRCSGTLTKPYSAICVESTVAAS